MISANFQVSTFIVRGGGILPQCKKIENCAGENLNFNSGGIVRRSDFYHLNIFQSYKQNSVNTERNLKSNLA